jgi:hypothetical protein
MEEARLTQFGQDQLQELARTFTSAAIRVIGTGGPPTGASARYNMARNAYRERWVSM